MAGWFLCDPVNIAGVARASSVHQSGHRACPALMGKEDWPHLLMGCSRLLLQELVGWAMPPGLQTDQMPIGRNL